MERNINMTNNLEQKDLRLYTITDDIDVLIFIIYELKVVNSYKKLFVQH